MSFPLEFWLAQHPAEVGPRARAFVARVHARCAVSLSRVLRTADVQFRPAFEKVRAREHIMAFLIAGVNDSQSRGAARTDSAAPPNDAPLPQLCSPGIRPVDLALGFNFVFHWHPSSLFCVCVRIDSVFAPPCCLSSV